MSEIENGVHHMKIQSLIDPKDFLLWTRWAVNGVEIGFKVKIWTFRNTLNSDFSKTFFFEKK